MVDPDEAPTLPLSIALDMLIVQICTCLLQLLLATNLQC